MKLKPRNLRWQARATALFSLLILSLSCLVMNRVTLSITRSLSLRLVPAMYDGIIGIPFKRRLRIMFRHPSIKGIVQEKISQQGAG